MIWCQFCGPAIWWFFLIYTYFCIIFFQTVINSVDNLLSITAMDHYSKVRHDLWHTLNEEIRLQDCDIYSYTPDLANDPFVEDGCLWSFNYFFYNRKMKRVVLFTCQAQSPFSGQSSWYGNPEDEMDVFENWKDFLIFQNVKIIPILKLSTNSSQPDCALWQSDCWSYSPRKITKNQNWLKYLCQSWYNDDNPEEEDEMVFENWKDDFSKCQNYPYVKIVH